MSQSRREVETYKHVHRWCSTLLHCLLPGGGCERAHADSWRLLARSLCCFRFISSPPRAPAFQEIDNTATEGFGRDDEERGSETDPSIVLHVGEEHTAVV